MRGSDEGRGRSPRGPEERLAQRCRKRAVGWASYAPQNTFDVLQALEAAPEHAPDWSSRRGAGGIDGDGLAGHRDRDTPLMGVCLKGCLLRQTNRASIIRF